MAGHARSSTGAGRVGFIFRAGRASLARASRSRSREIAGRGRTSGHEQRLRLVEVHAAHGTIVLVETIDEGPHAVVPQLDHTAVQRREDPWPLGVKGQALHAVRLGLRTHLGEYRMGQSKRSTGGTRAESGAITRGGHSRAGREGEVTAGNPLSVHSTKGGRTSNLVSMVACARRPGGDPPPRTLASDAFVSRAVSLALAERPPRVSLCALESNRSEGEMLPRT